MANHRVPHHRRANSNRWQVRSLRLVCLIGTFGFFINDLGCFVQGLKECELSGETTIELSPTGSLLAFGTETVVKIFKNLEKTKKELETIEKIQADLKNTEVLLPTVQCEIKPAILELLSSQDLCKSSMHPDLYTHIL
eukprot:GHVT01009016.1.p1 GENE.GHVT01009016.1~~GHVT01009016.1.p1  ORF type:complete len:138 (+),score=2.98 GHVT01009016.1:78-491(+)